MRAIGQLLKTSRGCVAAALVVLSLACGRGNGGDTGVAETPAAPAAPLARVLIKGILAQATDSGAVLTLAAGDTVHLSPSTLALYRGVFRFWGRGKPAWSADDAVLPRGRNLLAALKGAEEDGLNPARYRYDVAEGLLQAIDAHAAGSRMPEPALAKHLADFDLLVTEGFSRYAVDLTQGTIDPSSGGLKWRIPRGQPAHEDLLRELVKDTDVKQVVETLRPKAPYYARMMQALARYREVKTKGDWPNVTNTTELRARLIAGADEQEAALAQTGSAEPAKLDADLKAALKHFQKRHALEQSAKLDKSTLKELNRPVDEVLAELRLNMDRWRWLPYDLGELYILVNVAGFELEVVENAQPIMRMNVVVGKPAWATPIFADTMEYMVVNPSWNVPPSIYKQEVLPAMMKNPNYLAEHDMERTKDGSVRQRPGLKNPLGQYKFMFPNSDNIYLHDSPADHLYVRRQRAFSHGCIRLEKPAELARLITEKATSYSVSDMERLHASGQEKFLGLSKKVPVYILYFTSWVDEDGTVKFYHDIYGKNEELAPQLEKLDVQPTIALR
jgi:murein L,D-transpeptidase YcbB/YkuD